jgi:glutaredoxin-like YruB-family protein
MNVKVYSTPSCPWCQLTKKYLKEHNIPFEDIDVSRDEKAAMEMVLKSGQMGVPVIEIDDNIIIGFNKPLIDELLGLNKNDSQEK